MINTADSGAGSLRQAILDANAAGGPDTITFAIPGSGPFVIQPITLLPPLAGETTLDGTTQPGYAGTPLIELANFSGAGLRMTGTGGNTIRGVCVHDFTAGVQIESNDNVLEASFIGTDPTGTAGPGNGTGVVITAATSGNMIGGSAPGAGNLISGNGTGVQSTGGGINVIQGNLIGTDVTGNSAIPNGEGISLTGTTGFLIGGSNPGEGNVISGNAGNGIHVSVGNGCTIQGNKIGTNSAGTESLANQYGIYSSAASALVIGGDFNAGDANLISGNQLDGVSILGGVGTVVKGNTIGTDPTALQPLGNGGSGVYLDQNATDTLIGGVAAGEANAIAWNQNGVYNLGVRNAIRANPIFFNERLGIDNSPAGVTKNDPLDADTGANQLQNFPQISSVDYGTTTLTVHGILKSSPSTTFDLDFFESPSCTPRPRDLLQSAYFLGTQQVTTDGAGDAPFDILLNDNNASGQPPISATATDPNGNTSEFSQNVIYASSPRSGPPAGGVTVAMTGTHFLAGRHRRLRRGRRNERHRRGRHRHDRLAPALPAATVNDIVVTNTDGTAGTLRKAWIVDFLDVPPAQLFYNFVTTLVSNAITVGVGGGNYGVDQSTLRQQMAVFLLKGRHGICYVPPDCTPGLLRRRRLPVHVRQLDPGAGGGGHHRRLRQRQLLPDQARPPGPDGRLSSEGRARPGLRAARVRAAGRLSGRRLSGPVHQLDRAARRRGHHGRLRQRATTARSTPTRAGRWPSSSRRRSTCSSTPCARNSALSSPSCC